MINEKGSFRDPSGNIFYKNNRVFRKINKSGEERLKFLLNDNLLKDCIENNFLINSWMVDNDLNRKEDKNKVRY